MKAVPIEKGRRTVVYSLELKGLRGGEQLAVRARLATSAARLPEAARITTRLFLADEPDQREPGGEAKRVASFNGHVSRFNGFNCLPEDERSVTEKVGALRITRAPSKPLYLNLVAVSAAPFGRIPAGSGLPVLDDGWIKAVRYPPDLDG